MIVERSMNDAALSNTYLVGDEAGGGFFVDAGGPVGPLIEAAEKHSIEPTHVLLTHHHADHVWDLEKITDRWPGIEVLIDDRELAAMEDQSASLISKVTGSITSGEDIAVGSLTVTPLHTPGHTAGMQSLLVGGNVFTGDTLFKNSVGGVRAPLSTSYADLKSSVMDTLMRLPPETVIRPGHTDPTTVGEEWENNSFVRVWRGLDEEGDEQCTALGEPATLVLLGDDYDGGHKAWIRWPDGKDDIVPGSKVSQ
jgi:hydroxyacylglutathione hydrolase